MTSATTPDNDDPSEIAWARRFAPLLLRLCTDHALAADIDDIAHDPTSDVVLGPALVRYLRLTERPGAGEFLTGLGQRLIRARTDEDYRSLLRIACNIIWGDLRKPEHIGLTPDMLHDSEHPWWSRPNPDVNLWDLLKIPDPDADPLGRADDFVFDRALAAAGRRYYRNNPDQEAALMEGFVRETTERALRFTLIETYDPPKILSRGELPARFGLVDDDDEPVARRLGTPSTSLISVPTPWGADQSPPHIVRVTPMHGWPMKPTDPAYAYPYEGPPPAVEHADELPFTSDYTPPADTLTTPHGGIPVIGHPDGHNPDGAYSGCRQPMRRVALGDLIRLQGSDQVWRVDKLAFGEARPGWRGIVAVGADGYPHRKDPATMPAGPADYNLRNTLMWVHENDTVPVVRMIRAVPVTCMLCRGDATLIAEISTLQGSWDAAMPLRGVCTPCDHTMTREVTAIRSEYDAAQAARNTR